MISDNITVHHLEILGKSPDMIKSLNISLGGQIILRHALSKQNHNSNSENEDTIYYISIIVISVLSITFLLKFLF